MKYFSVHPTDLETEEFLSSSNDQIATWILLHAYCSKQLNSGQITSADSLPPRFWMRHGIDLNVVKADSPLWRWEGSTLNLDFYDLSGQELYIKKVEGGKMGGKKRTIRTPSSTPSTYYIRGEEIENTIEEEREDAALARSSHSEIVGKINSVAQGWASTPVLSAKEQAAYDSNVSMLEAVTEETWNAMRGYYRAKLPEGKTFHRPRSRERFIADLPDIAEYADQWERIQPKKPKPKPKPKQEEPEEEPMTPEEYKAFFADINKATASTHI